MLSDISLASNQTDRELLSLTERDETCEPATKPQVGSIYVSLRCIHLLYQTLIPKVHLQVFGPHESPQPLQ